MNELHGGSQPEHSLRLGYEQKKSLLPLNSYLKRISICFLYSRTRKQKVHNDTGIHQAQTINLTPEACLWRNKSKKTSVPAIFVRLYNPDSLFPYSNRHCSYLWSFFVWAISIERSRRKKYLFLMSYEYCFMLFLWERNSTREWQWNKQTSKQTKIHISKSFHSFKH